MTDITTYMTCDHRDCDDALVEFENMIATLNWDNLKASWRTFAKKFEHHFEIEETILFPAFELATGIVRGPTAVMRSEHQQMRSLVFEVEQAIEAKDAEQCQGVTDTLMIMIQQHNMKEEQILYPMADQHTDTGKVMSSIQSTVN